MAVLSEPGARARQARRAEHGSAEGGEEGAGPDGFGQAEAGVEVQSPRRVLTGQAAASEGLVRTGRPVVGASLFEAVARNAVE